MSKAVKGAIVAAALLIVLLAGIATAHWSDVTENDVPKPLPTFPTDGDDTIWAGDEELKENSLGFAIFEKYGIVLIPLAALMFGAMVAGVVISREEVEIDDSN